MVHSRRLALLFCFSSLPGHGIRVVKHEEAPLQQVGGGKAAEPLVVEPAPDRTEELRFESADVGKQQVTWRTNELVGYVGEGNVVAIGAHGAITSLRSSDMTAVVRYGNGTSWRHLVGELYKVNDVKYGFKGGQRVEFIGGSNSGNIFNRQLGIVCTFSESARLVNWWDRRQLKMFGVTPEMIRVPDPYAPKRGAGAWMPKYSVYSGSSITETTGTTKSSSTMQESSWSTSVTSTLSVKMTAGVKFLGASLGVETGIEISGTTSRSHTSSVSESWTVSRQSEYTLPFTANGYLWQWEIRTELDNSQVVSSYTKNFAVTRGAWEAPRCLPGYQMDGLAHQECFSREFTLS